MKTVRIHLDPSVRNGKIRNILGINNSPRLSSHLGTLKEKELLDRLAPACVRWHDSAGGGNSGEALIDISRIFPLFHADENDPANYLFKATDFYISQALDCGAGIEFRLGEQIDHSDVKIRIQCPSDMEKWARICLNVIRHYNEGWADGMKLGIRDWSIWEEPNNTSLFMGSGKVYYESYPEYYRLYEITAKSIRKHFPSLRIGGPNAIPAIAMTDEFFPEDHPQTSFCGKFLDYCRLHDVPLDFFSVTHYCRDPRSFVMLIENMRKLTAKHGFPEVGLRIAEFNLYPMVQWDTLESRMNRTFNAAFLTVSLLRMLKTPLEIASFYSWFNSLKYTIFDLNGNPGPVYYGLCSYTEMTRCAAGLVPEISGEIPENTEILAGIEEDGKVKVLISAFQPQSLRLEFKMPGCTGCRVRSLNDRSEGYREEYPLTADRDGCFAFEIREKEEAVAILEFSR